MSPNDATRYRSEFLSSGDQIRALAERWEACRQRDDWPHVEQHPEWLMIEARAAALEPTEQARGILAATLYQDNTLVGIAPFLRYRMPWECRLGYRTMVRFPMRIAELLGDSLICPGDPAAHEALLRGLDGDDAPFDMLHFVGLPTASMTWKVMQRSRALHRHYWCYTPDAPSQRRMIHLRGTLSDYLAELGKEARRDLKRSVRKLEKARQGAVTLERVSRAEDVQRFLAHVEQISAHGWRCKSLGHSFRPSPSYDLRYRERAESGWMRSYLLRCGDVPIAYQIGWQAGGVYFASGTAYDSDWRAHSPGKALLYLLLEDLHADDKPEWFDFLTGDMPYKAEFSNHSFEDIDVYLIRKSAYAGLAVAMHASSRAATRATLRGLERLGLRQKLHQSLRR